MEQILEEDEEVLQYFYVAKIAEKHVTLVQTTREMDFVRATTVSTASPSAVGGEFLSSHEKEEQELPFFAAPSNTSTGRDQQLHQHEIILSASDVEESQSDVEEVNRSFDANLVGKSLWRRPGDSRMQRTPYRDARSAPRIGFPTSKSSFSTQNNEYENLFSSKDTVNTSSAASSKMNMKDRIFHVYPNSSGLISGLFRVHDVILDVVDNTKETKAGRLGIAAAVTEQGDIAIITHEVANHCTITVEQDEGQGQKNNRRKKQATGSKKKKDKPQKNVTAPSKVAANKSAVLKKRHNYSINGWHVCRINTLSLNELLSYGGPFFDAELGKVGRDGNHAGGEPEQGEDSTAQGRGNNGGANFYPRSAAAATRNNVNVVEVLGEVGAGVGAGRNKNLNAAINHPGSVQPASVFRSQAAADFDETTMNVDEIDYARSSSSSSSQRPTSTSTSPLQESINREVHQREKLKCDILLKQVLLPRLVQRAQLFLEGKPIYLHQTLDAETGASLFILSYGRELPRLEESKLFSKFVTDEVEQAEESAGPPGNDAAENKNRRSGETSSRKTRKANRTRDSAATAAASAYQRRSVSKSSGNNPEELEQEPTSKRKRGSALSQTRQDLLLDEEQRWRSESDNYQGVGEDESMAIKRNDFSKSSLGDARETTATKKTARKSRRRKLLASAEAKTVYELQSTDHLLSPQLLQLQKQGSITFSTADSATALELTETHLLSAATASNSSFWSSDSTVGVFGSGDLDPFSASSYDLEELKFEKEAILRPSNYVEDAIQRQQKCITGLLSSTSTSAPATTAGGGLALSSTRNHTRTTTTRAPGALFSRNLNKKIFQMKSIIQTRQQESLGNKIAGVNVQFPLFSVSWIHDMKEMLALRVKEITLQYTLPKLLSRDQIRAMITTNADGAADVNYSYGEGAGIIFNPYEKMQTGNDTGLLSVEDRRLAKSSEVCKVVEKIDTSLFVAGGGSNQAGGGPEGVTSTSAENKEKVFDKNTPSDNNNSRLSTLLSPAGFFLNPTRRRVSTKLREDFKTFHIRKLKTVCTYLLDFRMELEREDAALEQQFLSSQESKATASSSRNPMRGSSSIQAGGNASFYHASENLRQSWTSRICSCRSRRRGTVAGAGDVNTGSYAAGGAHQGHNNSRVLHYRGNKSRNGRRSNKNKLELHLAEKAEREARLATATSTLEDRIQEYCPSMHFKIQHFQVDHYAPADIPVLINRRFLHQNSRHFADHALDITMVFAPTKLLTATDEKVNRQHEKESDLFDIDTGAFNIVGQIGDQSVLRPGLNNQYHNHIESSHEELQQDEEAEVRFVRVKLVPLWLNLELSSFLRLYEQAGLGAFLNNLMTATGAGSAVIGSRMSTANQKNTDLLKREVAQWAALVNEHKQSTSAGSSRKTAVESTASVSTSPKGTGHIRPANSPKGGNKEHLRFLSAELAELLGASSSSVTAAGATYQARHQEHAGAANTAVIDKENRYHLFTAPSLADHYRGSASLNSTAGVGSATGSAGAGAVPHLQQSHIPSDIADSLRQSYNPSLRDRMKHEFYVQSLEEEFLGEIGSSSSRGPDGKDGNIRRGPALISPRTARQNTIRGLHPTAAGPAPSRQLHHPLPARQNTAAAGTSSSSGFASSLLRRRLVLFEHDYDRHDYNIAGQHHAGGGSSHNLVRSATTSASSASLMRIGTNASLEHATSNSSSLSRSKTAGAFAGASFNTIASGAGVNTSGPRGTGAIGTQQLQQIRAPPVFSIAKHHQPKKKAKLFRIRELIVDQMRGTINIRTPDVQDMMMNQDYRKLAILVYLPLDMPNISLQINTQRLLNKLGTTKEILTMLKRSYLKNILYETGVAFASSYLLTAYKGVYNGLQWFFRAPYDHIVVAYRKELERRIMEKRIKTLQDKENVNAELKDFEHLLQQLVELSKHDRDLQEQLSIKRNSVGGTQALRVSGSAASPVHVQHHHSSNKSSSFRGVVEQALDKKEHDKNKDSATAKSKTIKEQEKEAAQKRKELEKQLQHEERLLKRKLRRKRALFKLPQIGGIGASSATASSNNNAPTNSDAGHDPVETSKAQTTAGGGALATRGTISNEELLQQNDDQESEIVMNLQRKLKRRQPKRCSACSTRNFICSKSSRRTSWWIVPLQHGLSEGAYRAMTEISGNILITIVFVANFLHKLSLGSSRQKANGILQGIVFGIRGFFLDSFLTPTIRLISWTQNALHDYGRSVAFLSFLLALLRIPLGPVFGFLHLIAAVCEGLASALLQEEAQFALFEPQRTLI
ncbi:unnamed protein product [Amoebophrya sp. A120]|nr:unnamed protein product [Amoebophrya sp. A120]|eukprot:GSA120T00009935001.1